MSSVYERDYVTIPTSPDDAGKFKTQAELDAHVAGLQQQMKAAAEPRVREGGDHPRPHQAVEEPRAGAGREPAVEWPSKLETWAKAAVLEVQEYVRLLGKVARAVVTPPVYYRDVVEQFDSIGIGSLTVVLLAGLFTGMVLALNSGMTLDKFGARSMVGQLISASMVKELGPVLTGLMVSGRVGSGIAAEIGSMLVTDQIAALRALGTDPIRKLVVPRVLAGVLMMPILSVLATGIGMVGGWIVTVLQFHVASTIYWSSVVQGLYMQDVWMGLIKPVFLGFTIVTIGCHVGLRTTGGTQGVGNSTKLAVVASSVAVIAVDFMVTKVLIVLMY